ncbi:MAG: DUF3016 domain-containing protein [Betaproteobacteria bacterium]|nr:DUF3016 domain-containing protein [Betaproteobacteria bacterium]
MKRSKFRTLLPVVSCALIAAASPAWAGASVKFTGADHFTDLPFASWDRTEVMQQLEAHFAKLAKSLPAGQDLKVEVTDIDLAGTIDPTRSPGRDLRILRGMADWPRINLKYTVEAGGKAVKSGEATVSDMNYLRNHNRYPNNEPLRYEKRMLDRWFSSDVLGARA